MEAAIRWSPHSTPDHPRFLVLNLVEKYLKFYEIESLRDDDQLDYRQISQHTNLPHVRAFDWSPVEEKLVAVGLASGEANLLRIDDSSNGILPFSIKQQRPCNAIALNTRGLLATGLDRVRSDSCLIIWDVNQRLSSWNRNERGWGSLKAHSEPLRRLWAPDIITSIKFFADQPETIVAGSRTSPPTVRLYDLRSSSGNPTLQIPTRCIHNLSIDALDENYFASASSSGESLVCVWDKRWGGQATAASFSSGNSRSHHEHPEALLEYNVLADYSNLSARSPIWSVRFSKAKRGAFGVLTSDGLLKVYETSKRWVSPSKANGGEYELLETKRVREVQQPPNDGLFRQPQPPRIGSFDFMTYGRAAEEYSILTHRADGSLKSLRLNAQPPPIDFDFFGDVVVGTRPFGYERHPNVGEAGEQSIADSLKAVRAKNEATDTSQQPRRASSNHANGDVKEPVLSSRQRHQQLLSFLSQGNKLPYADLFTAEGILSRRAKEDYLYDCKTNRQVVSDNSWLQNLWTWVQCAEKGATENGMVHGRLDLSFVGVQSIWNRDLGQNATWRLRKNADELPTAAEFRKAVSAICGRRKRPRYSGVGTSFPDQRQLCLAICGWAQSAEDFEAELRSIAAEESKTKAAGWAMFNNMPRLATQLVMRGDENEKLVAMALAGFYKQIGFSKDAKDAAWIELCQEIRDKAKDPWSRAILALVTTEDWHSVLSETSLPLQDRVGIALRYLNDEQLTAFINRTTAECIERGDIEGICLTGITDKAMDLFERYITRFNDVTTAVLVMSIGCPIYIKDIRFLKWKRLYQNALNAARLHVHRCEFEMRHMQRAITWDGRRLIQPPLRQISLRCTYCDRNLSHDDDGETIASESSNAATLADQSTVTVHAGNPLYGRGASRGVTCPRCNRHLPRCGVCDRWLGVPDLHRPLGSSMEQEEDTLSRFMLFCNVCDHAFHADHARTWFSTHEVCPVSDCTCLCQAYEA